ILNKDDPTNPVEEDGIVESEDIKEIGLERWRSQEVKDALKRTNPGKVGWMWLDGVMRKATADKRRGIRWNFTGVLEDHDFADDIALLSSTFKDLHEKTGRLAEKAARVGLKL
ncbi:unnamed protein product, partial [Porites evermanni]